MFLASGRAGVVRMLLLRGPNILCAEFLDVAGIESWCDEKERCASLLRSNVASACFCGNDGKSTNDTGLSAFALRY